jgi:nitrite reductase (NADH) small subunit
MNWIRITETQNIPPREGRVVKLQGREIAIFNLVDHFAAIENKCPHSGGPLCDGIVSGRSVVCPLHGWKISLETGEVLRGDTDSEPVDVFPARVHNGAVMVNLEAITQERQVA